MNVSTVTPASAPSKSALTDSPTGFILRDVPRVGTAPLVTCDLCGKTITHLHNAGVVWGYDDLPCTPRIYCKFGDADRKTLGCLSDPFIRYQPWMELSAFLFDLLHNLGVRTKKQMLAEFEHAGLAAELADRFF